jgi:putative restriction endonuclease
LEEEVWKEFTTSPNATAFACETALLKLGSPTVDDILVLPSTPTERIMEVKIRLVQSFFRAGVLSSYNYRCSFCDLEQKELLVAGHIIPWSANEDLRADPRNGICLCALHDKAFDRGLLAIAEDFSILVSGRIDRSTSNDLTQIGLINLEGKKMNLAERFQAFDSSLAYHREKIFD